MNFEVGIQSISYSISLDLQMVYQKTSTSVSNQQTGFIGSDSFAYVYGLCELVLEISDVEFVHMGLSCLFSRGLCQFLNMLIHEYSGCKIDDDTVKLPMLLRLVKVKSTSKSSKKVITIDTLCVS